MEKKIIINSATDKNGKTIMIVRNENGGKTIGDLSLATDKDKTFFEALEELVKNYIG